VAWDWLLLSCSLATCADFVTLQFWNVCALVDANLSFACALATGVRFISNVGVAVKAEPP